MPPHLIVSEFSPKGQRRESPLRVPRFPPELQASDIFSGILNTALLLLFLRVPHKNEAKRKTFQAQHVSDRGNQTICRFSAPAQTTYGVLSAVKQIPKPGLDHWAKDRVQMWSVTGHYSVKWKAQDEKPSPRTHLSTCQTAEFNSLISE